SRTLMPASRSAFAVPPVLVISTLKRVSSRAKSTMPVLSETLISARRIGRKSVSVMLYLVRKFLCSGWQIDHELLRARITLASDGVFDTLRLHTDGENMLAIIARRFGYIETQKVLAFQILFDRLKDRRQIVLVR